MSNHEAMHGETVGLFEPFSNGAQTPGEPDSSPPTWALQKRLRAIELRGQGLSYEAISEAVSDEQHGIPPWGIYAWCNDKTPEQIAAWKRRHHPDPDAWSLEFLEKRNPDALRRQEEANARELEYVRRKGL